MSEVLTLREASKYLKIHTSTLYRLSLQGKIPASKIGKIWRFKREDIDKWLEQSKVKNDNKKNGQISAEKVLHERREKQTSTLIFNGKIDRRKFQRLEKSIPVRLSIPSLASSDVWLSQDYEIIGRNISEGGIFVEVIVPKKDFVSSLLSRSNKLLELRLVEKGTIIKLFAKPVWSREISNLIDNRLGCGLKFVEVPSKEKNRLASYISEYITGKKPAEIDTFSLLVDGKDVDTGIYEYFPYADKAILDFKTTYSIIRQLKEGEKPQGYQNYVVARYCVGTEDTNQKAIKAAYKASKTFRNFPLEKRRKIVGDIHDLLVANRDKLIKLLVAEGHPVKLAEWEFSGMEAAYRKETLDFYKGELWKETQKGDETIHIVRKPDGVVCLSPPKNASCSNSLLAAFAFLSGNTLIVKPPLRMPLSTIYLWKDVVNEALKRNNAPDGTLNIVLGNSKKIMDEWLSSPCVSDIVYFGDSKIGLEIGNRAYLAGKKAILELSGNDILFVWKDAEVDRAARALLDCFLGSTQICMVPKQAIIHQDIYEEFTQRFVEGVKKIKVGLPSNPQTCLSPVVKYKDFFEFLKDALEKGAELILGGRRTDHQGVVKEDGIYIEPTVIRIDNEQKAKTMRVIQEENFFPLMPLVRVTGKNDDEIFDKMLDLSNANEYGLRTSVWITSDYYTKRFINEIQNTGLLRINVRHVGFSLFTSTHGGTGKTGGPYGEMNYMWQKTSHLQGITIKTSERK